MAIHHGGFDDTHALKLLLLAVSKTKQIICVYSVEGRW